MFIKCNDANHICDKNQYKEASLVEKIKLTIHILYCKACRKYSTNNGKLTKLVNDPKVISIDQSIKNTMKEELKKKMSEQ